MPKSKKENIEEMTLDPIEEKVKEPAPVEEPVEEPVEPEAIEEGEDITEPDAPIEPEFEEPVEEGNQGEDVEFDEEAGEETDEDAPEEDAPPFLGLMLGAKNAPVSEDPDPQSRIEALLWHIINGTTTDAEPQSRNEAILTAIANGGTYTEEAQSRIEALLIAILNHEESDITPISRNEAILKAIANTGEYNEEPQSRNEELLIKWLEAISIVIGTASGAVASFNTSLTENLLSAVAEFSASQASGTPTPANPIPIVGVDKVNVTRTQNNIFTSPIERGNISAYGENTDNLNPNRSRTAKQIAVSPSTGYTVGNAENYKVGIFYYTSNGTFISYLTWDDTPRTFTTPSNCAFVRFAYQNTSGTYPTKNQLCKGTTLDNYDQTVATALINLGGTYYGGEVDAVTGKITLTHQIEDLGNLTYERFQIPSIPSAYYFRASVSGAKVGAGLLSSGYSYVGNGTAVLTSNYTLGNSASNTNIFIRNDDYTDAPTFKTNMQGIKIVYELATPIVVYASNTAEIPTINGLNQVYADTGDVEVEYKKRRND